MAKTLCLFNHKGGVSKTTTTFNLGWVLADMCIGLRFFGHVFVDQAAMFTASFWMARTADGVL